MKGYNATFKTGAALLIVGVALWFTPAYFHALQWGGGRLSLIVGEYLLEATIALGAACLIVGLWQKPAPGTVLPRGSIEAEFPGFTAAPGEIIAKKGRRYRVNANGSWHLLSKWYFHPATGEFYRITRRHRRDGSITYSSIPYSERRLLVHKGREALIGHLLAAMLGLALFLFANVAGGYGIVLRVLGIAIGGLTGARVAMLVLSSNDPDNRLMFTDNQSGPEPLTRKTDHFGASSAEAPADHAADADLDYPIPNA